MKSDNQEKREPGDCKRTYVIYAKNTYIYIQEVYKYVCNTYILKANSVRETHEELITKYKPKGAIHSKACSSRSGTVCSGRWLVFE